MLEIIVIYSLKYGPVITLCSGVSQCKCKQT